MKLHGSAQGTIRDSARAKCLSGAHLALDHIWTTVPSVERVCRRKIADRFLLSSSGSVTHRSFGATWFSFRMMDERWCCEHLHEVMFRLQLKTVGTFRSRHLMSSLRASTTRSRDFAAFRI